MMVPPRRISSSMASPLSSSPPPLRFGVLLLASLDDRYSLGTAPHCGAESSSPPSLRFGVLLLASLDNRYSLGTAPHCGARRTHRSADPDFGGTELTGASRSRSARSTVARAA